jgi:hypothetical protein
MFHEWFHGGLPSPRHAVDEMFGHTSRYHESSRCELGIKGGLRRAAPDLPHSSAPVTQVFAPTDFCFKINEMGFALSAENTAIRLQLEIYPCVFKNLET